MDTSSQGTRFCLEPRRTLQLKDILAAINSSDQFDLLIDVVDDFKAGSRREE